MVHRDHMSSWLAQEPSCEGAGSRATSGRRDPLTTPVARRVPKNWFVTLSYSRARSLEDGGDQVEEKDSHNQTAADPEIYNGAATRSRGNTRFSHHRQYPGPHFKWVRSGQAAEKVRFRSPHGMSWGASMGPRR